MEKILKVTDVWGFTHLINTDKVIGVHSATRITKNRKDVPVWELVYPTLSISLAQEEYDIDDIRAGLEGYSTIFYNKSHKHEKEYEAKKKQQQTPQKPVFQYPALMDRYSFIYKKCNNYMDEAEGFVMNEEPCYLMFGEPLNSKAFLISQPFAENLLQTYDFDDDTYKLSWIEIDGHLALLFNNRLK